MAFSIGRAGIDTTLAEPKRWEERGSTVRLSGMFAESSLARAEALRYQLLSLGSNPGELTVPVTGDSLTREGMYVPREASVSPPVEYATKFYCDWDVTLERLSSGGRWGFAESYVRGATSLYGVVLGLTADFWHATPSDAVGYSRKESGTYYASTVATRTGPDGVVDFYSDANMTGDFVANWQIDPSDWYDAAVTLKCGGLAVAGLECVNDTTGWSLSNGIIKFEAVASHIFKVTFPIGGTNTSWGTAKNIALGYYEGGAWSEIDEAPVQVVPLRVSPEEVGVRLVVPAAPGPGGGTATTILVDLSLRRGSHIAYVHVHSVGNDTQLGIGTASATAMTALTGGIRATSSDADSNRIILMADQAVSTDLVNGRVYASSAQSFFRGGIGVILNGGSAASPNTENDIRDQFFAFQSEVTRAVNP